MYLFAFRKRQPCSSVKHVLKCSNAICEWPELSISIKYVVLYCIVLYLQDNIMYQHFSLAYGKHEIYINVSLICLCLCVDQFIDMME